MPELHGLLSSMAFSKNNDRSKGKQSLISMLYEIEHTNYYIEPLMNEKILCEY